jgi:hypothetical protein
MKISKLPLLAAILPLAAMLFLVPAQVHADTYQIFNLGTDNGFDLFDIDTSGVVIIFNTVTSNYLTVDHGVVVNTTSTLPSLTYDNGTPCSIPAGFASPPSNKIICNNGRIGFGSRSNPNGDSGGVYTGPISSLTLVDFGGTTDLAVLNSSGDFAWDDGLQDWNFEAIDLTTDVPEPASLLLLGTGCVSLLGFLRRKAVVK